MESRCCISQFVDTDALVAILIVHTLIIDLKLFWDFRLLFIKIVNLFWRITIRVLPYNIIHYIYVGLLDRIC